jgi:tetratricopeptide (TPR) repeat protein
MRLKSSSTGLAKSSANLLGLSCLAFALGLVFLGGSAAQAQRPLRDAEVSQLDAFERDNADLPDTPAMDESPVPPSPDTESTEDSADGDSADVDSTDVEPSAADATDAESTEAESTEAESTEAQERFAPSPLELEVDDPLLPQPVVDRPLSPLERFELQQALDELNADAIAEYQAGNVDEAFVIWYRELRLRRALGLEEELPALGRVGEVAWGDNRNQDVQIITARLREIEPELMAETPPNFDLMLTLAQSYQTLRAIDAAIALYEPILAQARAQQNAAIEQQTLQALGDLNLAWFRFAPAASAYQELLVMAQQRGDRPAEQTYLEQLAFAYQRGRLYAQALPIQQQLVSVYETQQQLERIAPLKIAIANNYRNTNRLDQAAITYQDAFVTARDQQQFGYASDALNRLADLYKSIDRTEDALLVYRALIQVESLSYNALGVMNVMDQMAQLHEARNEPDAAIAAYQEALELATLLDYVTRIGYFAQQIQRIRG